MSPIQHHSREPTIVVAGLGRCGTSLTMQMLAAGGVECVGRPPSFEDSRVKKAVMSADIEAWSGKAVKILDPQRVGLPGDVRVIWLDRAPSEQARSFAKFLWYTTGVNPSREQRRGIERSLRPDRVAAMRVIGRRPCLVMSFDRLVTRPDEEILKLHDFLQRPAFDVAAARAVMRRRTLLCEPGMDIELSLMRAADARLAA